MLLTELFDSKVSIKVMRDTDIEFATFAKITNVMSFQAYKLGSTGNYWDVAFGDMRPNGSLQYQLTNNQDAVKVLSFVTQSMSVFLKKHEPTKLKFEAHGNRPGVYRRMLSRLLPDYSVQELKYEHSSKFILTKKQLAEATFPALMGLKVWLIHTPDIENYF